MHNKNFIIFNFLFILNFPLLKQLINILLKLIGKIIYYFFLLLFHKSLSFKIFNSTNYDTLL